MKYKYVSLAFISLLCFFGLTIFAFMQNGSADKLKLTVVSSKTFYKLGEVVPLSFELKNESTEDISIADVFGVGTGYLNVFISQDGGESFQRYEHGWGLLDIANALTVLKPDGSVKSSATILQHYKPNGLAGESDMKNKRFILNVSIIMIFFCLICLAYGTIDTVKSSDKISVKISIPNESYKLGEVVLLDIEITNKTSEVIYLKGNEVNIVGIQISSNEKGQYQNYIGLERGFSLDGVEPEIRLGSMETIKTQKSVFWNYKPEVSHLNSDAAKPLLKDRILTDYAFTKAGTYSARAVLQTDDDAKSIKIESEPIQITILEPIGEDLEVWNLIKNNSDLGYFIQAGDYKRGDREKSAAAEIQQITEKYPNSSYVHTLQQSLEKFQVIEEKRKAFEEKMKANHPN